MLDYFFIKRKRHRRASAALRIRAARAEHANPLVFDKMFKNDITNDYGYGRKNLKRKYWGGF